MKTPSQTFLERLGLKDPVTEVNAAQNPGNDRRDFLKKVGAGGLMLGGFMFSPIEDTIAQATSKVNKASSPSDLKITDMRFAVVMNGHARCPIIRIDTNQGISGLGEVRDGASWRYAMFLKSRIMGMNPCSVEQIFKRIKQFGFHGRQGGGVCGVEMALWDLAGKAYNVPAYQLLGGRYRDKVRLYADTPEGENEADFANKVNVRMVEQGFTFMKMDFGIELLKGTPGTTVNSNYWDIGRQWTNEPMTYGGTEHPFTQVQITDKGLDLMTQRIAFVREKIGYEIPLASDHYGHFDHNNAIRLGRAVEKYRLAWLEDLIPWKFTDQWRQITEAIETPTLTGEDIYLKEEFIKLIDARAVDLVHPDLATSGGLLETKKIGDYAEERGVAMAMHFAGTPISFMANVHCAAATQNFVALEHHSVDVDYWTSLVKTKKPMIEKGYANVPDSPGLGIELNDDVVKKHLDPEMPGYFASSAEWDKDRSWDRLWS
ncbi:mandelate racemase/muconate lactonizing enzyme family protein [Chryseolinea lacunae]|uniref:Mandelate racemase/muconate lactonizing enzyme family protein n=1 Tax=Chryseolinea lacunae TaxID=2801331 RepID=A0ABS1L079_9BACT|nr:mandelate racemase/muconate lactonizing enzyme family protein [Chryseolinea lacunae]MBL0743976.1 mandelate racemase/muconate lactonizing enzyme family protein [Chryseolinea lacunae]